MKQKKIFTKAICFSAAFVMLLMSLTLEPGIDLLNSWLKSSAEDNSSENTVAEIPINANGYEIVETTEEVSIPTVVEFTWEEATESAEEETTTESTTLTGSDTSGNDDKAQTGSDENSNPVVTEPVDVNQQAEEADILSLRSAISNLEKYDTSNYTSASWESLQVKLSAANIILEKYNNNEPVLKTEVVIAITDIDTAVKGLVSIKELSELVKKAESLNEREYTAKSFAEVSENLTKANTVKKKTDATQDEVDAAVNALKTAVESLVKKQYKLSWNNEYVTAYYQDGENKVEIKKDETKIDVGTEVNVVFTEQGEKIYSSIKSETQKFKINDNKKATISLDPKKTTVSYDFAEIPTNAPSISCKSGATVSYGQIITVNPTAAYSVVMTDDKGNTKKFDVSDGQDTFYICTLGVQRLTFTADTKSYKVSLSDDINKYFTNSGIEKGMASFGSAVTLTINKDKCNGINVESLLKSVTVYIDNDQENNLAERLDDTIKFTMPASPVTISASATPVTYSEITTENCSVETTTDEDGAIVFDKDGNASFKVTTNDGYKLGTVTIKDAEETTIESTKENNIDSATYTFSKKGIHSDVSVIATCEAVTYGKITSEYGTVSVNKDDIVFDKDGKASFTVTPNETGSDSKKNIVTGVEVLSNNEKVPVTSNIKENGLWEINFTNKNMHSDIIIKVKYACVVTTIAYINNIIPQIIRDDNENIAASYNYTDSEGNQCIDIMAQSGTGYHITSFSEEPNTYKDIEAANGVNNNKYNKTATAVYNDVSNWMDTKEITVTFAIDTFNIKAESTGNGSVSDNQTVEYSQDATVTVTPNNDSYVSKIVIKDTVTDVETTVFDTNVSQDFSNNITMSSDEIKIEPTTNGSVDIKFLTVKSDYEVITTFSTVADVDEEISGIKVEGRLSDDLDTGVNYKYIVGGKNVVNRGNLKLSFVNTDFSVACFIGNIDTTINSISYADSCTITDKDISTSNDTVITFYLRNKSTYEVTKLTVTLVPDNKDPDIKGENKCGEDSDGWVQNTIFDVTVRDNPSVEGMNDNSGINTINIEAVKIAAGDKEKISFSYDELAEGTSKEISNVGTVTIQSPEYVGENENIKRISEVILSFSFDKDYHGYITVTAADCAGNSKTHDAIEVKNDVTAPTIEGKNECGANSDGWVQNTIFDVAVEDPNFEQNLSSGLSEINISGTDLSIVDYNSENLKNSEYKLNCKNIEVGSVKLVKTNNSLVKLSFNFKGDYQGYITVSATDCAGNDRSIGEPIEVKNDVTDPTNLTVTYENEPKNTVGNTRYYGEQVHVIISADDNLSGIYKFEWEGKLTRNLNPSVPSSAINVGVGTTVIEYATDNINYSNNGKTATADFYIPKELLNETNSFDGNVYFKAYDRAENNTDKTDATRLVTDKIAPTRIVTYSEPKQVIDAKTHNSIRFKPTAENENSILYYDENATLTIAITEANFYSKDVKIYVNGNKVDPDGTWKTNGDVHTNTLTLSDEGEYIVKIEYTDKSGNKMESYTSEVIVVDTTNPTRIVTYSNPKQVLNAATFKSIKFNATSEDNNSIFYYDGKATLTIAITEANFYSEDVNIYVNGNKVAPDGTWKTKDDVHTNTLTLKDDGEYIVTIEYTDKSGNRMTSYKSEKIVVDKTAPTLEDTYSNEKQIVNNIHYYDGNATLTIAITEANFYSEDVIVTVNDKAARLDGTWQTNGDVHTNTITLLGDGDYVVKVEYTDKSGNKMSSYESEKIVIDTIVPTVKVEYDNNDVKNTVDGRQYFDKQRTATITVTEHNFRADDINATVTSVDVLGNNVNVQDYHSYLLTRSSWIKQGDVYTAKITYSVDANYTFDIAYKDLALNESADYSEDKFTVDKTKPYNLKVTYENDPENSVGNTRYYGEQVHVMISAVDDTSPIYRFEYEGKLTQDDPISAVNRGVLQTIIESKTKEITREGNINKVDFYIPKELLNENNSFDGNVYFKAYDCAENNTDTTDATRLVADKIAPTRTVTFNGSEYTEKQYFNQDIDVNININEANFNSNDVIISVTKDGKSYSDSKYSVNWNSSSVDSHIGSFTLTEDGDYVVNVTYTDKSGNKMQDYTSPVIVLDTVKPVVEIDKINGKNANESAHNDETIGITVKVTDKNIEAKNVELSLTAIINGNEKDDGKFIQDTTEISIGEPVLSQNADGETVLTYTIENLVDDGYYTLKCRATDLATNENLDQTNEKHIIDDGKVQEEEINFSVNRNGSVFWIEADLDSKEVDDISQELNNQYLNAKVSVTFHETNVDPLPDENVTQKTLIKDNEEVSEPKVDYSKEEVGSGGWYERSYTYKEENFDKDGCYTLRVTTTDKSGNVNDSSVSDKSCLRFTIDRTAPVIYSNVVEEGQNDNGKYKGKTINKAEQTVEISFAEPNLNVEKLRIVRVDGNNEEEIGDNDNLHIDENNVVTFTENNVLNDNIKVYAYDFAGNKSTYEIEDLTVTTNIFALWYANTFLFWSSIIGFIVLAGLFILFIILKKRNKSEDNE